MADDPARTRDEDDRWTRSENDDTIPSADERDRNAEERDTVSGARDRAAEVRDETAEARDRHAEARDEPGTRSNPAAAADRGSARGDRHRGAGDREHAAWDRLVASADRALSAGERIAASFDGLTGAHSRDAGLVELTRETARAKRTQTPLVLAFIDVDGLKVTNDSLGHPAGDQLLRRVVDTLRARFRSYDLIVRFGGDEFLCALLDLNITAAAERFALIKADLAAQPHASITAGLAALTEHDSLEDLIARAEATLRSERRQRPSDRSRPRAIDLTREEHSDLL